MKVSYLILGSLCKAICSHDYFEVGNSFYRCEEGEWVNENGFECSHLGQLGTSTLFLQKDWKPLDNEAVVWDSYSTHSKASWHQAEVKPSMVWSVLHKVFCRKQNSILAKYQSFQEQSRILDAFSLGDEERWIGGRKHFPG